MTSMLSFYKTFNISLTSTGPSKKFLDSNYVTPNCPYSNFSIDLIPYLCDNNALQHVKVRVGKELWVT